jgi:hypothetical protein
MRPRPHAAVTVVLLLAAASCATLRWGWNAPTPGPCTVPSPAAFCPPPRAEDDGIVAGESAHVEDADSELVVRTNHSCQAHPETVEEVRRILLAHLAEARADLNRPPPP